MYCVFVASPLWLAVGPRSAWGGLFAGFLSVCPFDCTAFAVSGRVGIPWTGLATPVGLLVTPTDRPRSVRNRCVIEVFGGVCVCCPLVFEFSVGVGGFVIGLGQISFFFSFFLYKKGDKTAIIPEEVFNELHYIAESIQLLTSFLKGTSDVVWRWNCIIHKKEIILAPKFPSFMSCKERIYKKNGLNKYILQKPKDLDKNGFLIKVMVIEYVLLAVWL